MTDVSRHQAEWRLWVSHMAPLTKLTASLTDEFVRNTFATAAKPLIVLGTGRERLVLVQPPDGLPVLQRETTSGPPEVILDFAHEKPAGPEFFLGGVAVDPTGDWIAYTVDGSGDDRYELRLRSLRRNEPARSVRTGVSAAVAWHLDADILVYAALDDTMRPAQIRATSTGGIEDRLLYESEDESAYVDLSVSGDGRTVFVALERHSGRSLYFLDRAARRVLPLWTAAGQGERVCADATAQRWILQRTGTEVGELLIADREDDSTPARWTLVATTGPQRGWDDFAVAGDEAFVVERGGGRQRLLRIGLTDAPAMDPVAFATVDDDGADPCSVTIVPSTCRTDIGIDLLCASWRAPETWFRIRSGTTEAQPVNPAVQPARAAIDVMVLSAQSRDRTAIPFTLLRPAGSYGPLPTVLYAYGAYGVALDPCYSPFRESLLSRNIAFAIAHVRGGGDQGSAWHDAGRTIHKHRAVEDYLACAATLVAEGWTTPKGLVARARSAGAAVVAAALNQEPNRFAAAVLEVPFLDCLATLSDPALPLTSVEWEEWGNPLTDPAAAAALRRLSPVDNVRFEAYPPILLTAGTSDSRVRVIEALRFADAVRVRSTARNPVLLKIDDAGHLGHSDVAADHQDEADVLAFVLHQLGAV